MVYAVSYFIGIFVFVVFLHSSQAGWQNNYQGVHIKQCIGKRSLWAMQSKFSVSFKDRRFEFLCRYNGQARICDIFWRFPLPANQLEKSFSFVCPKGYLSGIRSTFSGDHKDRRFRFKCCRSGTIQRPFNCKWTWFLNSYEEYFKFIAPSKPHYYLVGVWSIFSESKKDRRFRFKYCQAEFPLAPPPGK